VAALGQDLRTAKAKLSFERGLELLKVQNFADALLAFNKAVALYPTWGQANLELAICHFKTDYNLQEIEKALRIAGRSLSRNPRHQYWQGRLYEAQGKDEEALAAYRRAQSLRPGLLDVDRKVTELSHYIASKGKKKAAKPPLPGGRIVEEEESSEEARKAMSQLASAGFGEIDEVEKKAYKARDALHRGLASLEEGNLAAAAKFFKRSVRIAPFWSRPHLELAALHLYGDGDLPEAEKELLFVIASDPESSRAYFLMGLLHRTRGKIDAAIASLELAVLLRPSAVDARLELARTYESAGKAERAIEQYEAIVNARPQHLAARIAAAKLCEKLARFTDAERHFKELLRLAPQNALFYEQLADFYDRHHRFEESKAIRELSRKALPQPEKRKFRELPPSKK
jgi:tetratricopeptide (TPR) repeat protein